MTIKKELLGLIDAVDEPNELTQQSYEDAKRGNTKGLLIHQVWMLCLSQWNCEWIATVPSNKSG